MFDSHPENVSTLLVIGGLTTLLLRHVMAWRLDVGRSHLPWVLISASGIAFGVVRLMHLSTVDPASGLLLVRLQYAVAGLLPGLAVATLDTLAERPHNRVTYSLLAIPVMLSIPMVGSSWFVAGPGQVHHDAFGHSFIGGMPGSGFFLLVPILAWTGWVLYRGIRAMPGRLAATRLALRVVVAAFIGLAVHDSLLGSGAIESVHLFEYGYLVFAIVASRFEAQRAAAMRAELGEQLEDKRTALAAKERSLDAAMAELQASRARYQHLADATHEGVLLCDGPRIVDTNAALRTLLGLAPATLGERAAVELFVPGDRPQIAALLDGTIAGPLETRCLRGDGRELAVSVTATSAPGGGALGRVLLVRDLSQERELHLRLARADRLAALGTLAAGTAHEINNPLTYVMGNAELLADELDRLAPTLPPTATDPARALVADISGGTARIRRVVEQLLVLSRERTGDDGPVDVGGVLEQALAMAAHHLRHRARVVRDLAPVPKVFASAARLGQVFLNLIVNAAQAIPDGHADTNQVRVATTTSGDRVVITISDTGVGMDAEVRAHVFDPFFTTKDVGSGTGLGLSISLGIVTSLGGTIDVTSAPGQGTTVRVELPSLAAERPAVPTPVVVEASPAAVAAPSPRRAILVVDDEELVARAIARMLSAHQTEIACSGKDALTRCNERHFDVIVCDLMMPEMTGMELHQAVAAHDASISNRFVFLTGGVFTEAARSFLETPGRRWLGKPTSRRDLQRAIDDVLADA